MTPKASPHIVVADRIPKDGKSFRIAFDEAECHALAETLGIVEVVELQAELNLRPLAGDAYGVKGTLTAVVVQNDVVTLEPLRQEVSETIDLTLVPAEDLAEPESPAGVPGAEAERDTFANGRIDLGGILGEHLALGLDPYPRAAGVEFPGHVEDDSADHASPFAVLAALKRKPE